jgi:hypothetical protein
MATLDATDVVEARDAVASRVTARLGRVTPAGAVVGCAYAVDGRLKGVRWFANSRVFELFREVLVRTLDAITARAGNAPKAPPSLAPTVVKELIEAVDASEQKREQATAAENVNEYYFSGEGYGSRTRLKPKAGRKAVEVSSDCAAR